MEQALRKRGFSLVKKLAQGGQGEVFVVKKGSEHFALKVYNKSSATPEQRDIISFLASQGAPVAKYADRFAWPFDIIDDPFLAYFMPLVDTSKYISAENLPALSFGVRIEAGRQLAECFRELHIAGYSYCDISDRNFFLNPKNGDIVLIDNDNVFIDKMSSGRVLGTGGFMAPEVVRGEAKPSTLTDLHSLSALMFMILCGDNPFHGQKEDNIRIFDGIAAQNLYGLEPVFVFDPDDRSNALPDKGNYRNVTKNWSVLPEYIKALFVRAFTVGLKNPNRRVTDIEWAVALSQMLDMRHLCKCGAENFWDSLVDEKKCWNCHKTVSFPDKLYVYGQSSSVLLILPGQVLTTMHLGEKNSVRVLGEIETHPRNSKLCILRNKSGQSWTAVSGSQAMPVPPGKAIPLVPEIEVQVSGYTLVTRH